MNGNVDLWRIEMLFARTEAWIKSFMRQMTDASVLEKYLFSGSLPGSRCDRGTAGGYSGGESGDPFRISERTGFYEVIAFHSRDAVLPLCTWWSGP